MTVFGSGPLWVRQVVTQLVLLGCMHQGLAQQSSTINTSSTTQAIMTTPIPVVIPRTNRNCPFCRDVCKQLVDARAHERDANTVMFADAPAVSNTLLAWCKDGEVCHTRNGSCADSEKFLLQITNFTVCMKNDREGCVVKRFTWLHNDEENRCFPELPTREGVPMDYCDGSHSYVIKKLGGVMWSIQSQLPTLSWSVEMELRK